MIKQIREDLQPRSIEDFDKYDKFIRDQLHKINSENKVNIEQLKCTQEGQSLTYGGSNFDSLAKYTQKYYATTIYNASALQSLLVIFKNDNPSGFFMNRYFVIDGNDALCNNHSTALSTSNRDPSIISDLFNKRKDSDIRKNVDNMKPSLKSNYKSINVSKLREYITIAKTGKSVCVQSRWYVYPLQHMILLIFYYIGESETLHCGIYDPIYYIKSNADNYIGAVADAYVTLKATALLAEVDLEIHNWGDYCYRKQGSIRCVQYIINAEFCSMYTLYFCFLYGRKGFPKDIEGITDVINSTYLLSSPDMLKRDICKDTLKFKLIFISFIMTVLTIISDESSTVSIVKRFYETIKDKEGYTLLEPSIYEYLIATDLSCLKKSLIDSICVHLEFIPVIVKTNPSWINKLWIKEMYIILNEQDTTTLSKIERYLYLKNINQNTCFIEFFMKDGFVPPKYINYKVYAKMIFDAIHNDIKNPRGGVLKSKLKFSSDGTVIGLLSPYDTIYPKCNKLLQSDSLTAYKQNNLEKRNNRTRRQNAATTIAYKPFNKRWLKSTMLGFNTPERKLYRSFIPKIVDALKGLLGNEFIALDDMDTQSNQCMEEFIKAYIAELQLKNNYTGEPEAIAYYLLKGCSESLYSVIEKTTILLSENRRDNSQLISRLQKFLLIYFKQPNRNRRIEQLIDKDIQTLIDNNMNNAAFTDLRTFIQTNRSNVNTFNNTPVIEEKINSSPPLSPPIVAPFPNEPSSSPIVVPPPPPNKPSSSSSRTGVPPPPPNKPSSSPQTVVPSPPPNKPKPPTNVHSAAGVGLFGGTKKYTRYNYSKTRSKKRR